VYAYHSSVRVHDWNLVDPVLHHHASHNFLADSRHHHEWIGIDETIYGVLQPDPLKESASDVAVGKRTDQITPFADNQHDLEVRGIEISNPLFDCRTRGEDGGVPIQRVQVLGHESGRRDVKKPLLEHATKVDSA
jgi:hypothetical protein